MALKDIIFKVKADTKNAKKEMDNLGKTSTKLVGNLNKVAGAFGIAFGVQAVGDLIKMGNTAIQVEKSFDLMNKEVFKTPDLLDKMAASVNGTISQTELMSGLLTLTAGQTDEMASAFANAAPKLLEIAKASNKLNPALGDTAFLYESIAKGIKRGSPLILDNLGIVIDITEANKKYADALGKTTKELTADEKVMALLNATMTKGTKVIEQVGGSTESAGDEFAKMEVSVKESAEALAKGLMPVLDGLLSILTPLIQGLGWFFTEMAKGPGDIIRWHVEQEKLNAELERTSRILPETTEGLSSLVDGLKEINAELKKQREEAAGIEKLRDRIKELKDAIAAPLTETQKLNIEIKKLEGELANKLSGTLDKTNKKLEKTSNFLGLLFDKAITAIETINRLSPLVARGMLIPETLEGVKSVRKPTEEGAEVLPTEDELRETFKEFDIIADASAQTFRETFGKVLGDLFGDNSLLQKFLSSTLGRFIDRFAELGERTIFSGLLSLLPGGTFLTGLFGGGAGQARLGGAGTSGTVVIQNNIAGEEINTVMVDLVPNAINRATRVRKL